MGSGRAGRTMKILAIIGSMLLMFPGTAAAYLDPGNGSFIFQMLLGMLFTAAVTFRVFWAKLVLFLNNLLGRRSGIDPEK